MCLLIKENKNNNEISSLNGIELSTKTRSLDFDSPFKLFFPKFQLDQIFSKMESNLEQKNLTKQLSAQHNLPWQNQSELNGSEYRRQQSKVCGYLFKTAQCLASRFRPQQFFKRYYVLILETKQLLIFGKENGLLKDSVKCAVKHVVTNLRNDAEGCQPFFTRKEYEGIKIILPQGYNLPFAVFMEDGSMHLLWAQTQSEFISWTQAFMEIGGGQQSKNIHFPDLTDKNHFVASLYMSLMPYTFNGMSFDQLESLRENHRSNKSLTDIKDFENRISANQKPLVVTDHQVKGWLQKTAQELGIFQRLQFFPRYYVINVIAHTMHVYEEENDSEAELIEFRRRKLVRIETNLNRKLPETYKQHFQSSIEIELPSEKTEPFGLIFQDGGIMILWAKSGKEFKVWTRTFRRFLQPSQDTSPTYWLPRRKKNSFIINIFRSLLPAAHLNIALSLKENKLGTVEGWLCKTSPIKLAGSADNNPFVKFYCVLEIQQERLLFFDSLNGEVVESIQLKDRLSYIDFDISGKINNKNLNNDSLDPKQLEGLEISASFMFPFAIFFNDGGIALFWAQTQDDIAMWRRVLQNLLSPHQPEQVKYVVLSKANSLVSTLYASLDRKTGNDKTELLVMNESQSKQIEGVMYECSQNFHPQGQTIMFLERYYKLDLDSQSLQAFSTHSLTDELDMQISLANGVLKVETNLSKELSKDIEQLSEGLYAKGSIQLPQTDTAPFAVHLTDGKFLILWAPNEVQKQVWVAAFLKLQVHDTLKQLWIEENEDNNFALCLYKCLIPQIGEKVRQNDEQLDKELLNGWIHIAVDEISPDQDLMFKRKFLRFDADTLKLQICNEMGEIDEEIELEGKLRTVDTKLVNRLDPTFKSLSVVSYVKSKRASSLTIESVQLPPGEYPISLIFNDGELFLMWAQTLTDFHKWTSSLQKITATSQHQTEYTFLVKSARNYFKTTIYKCLERQKSQITALAPISAIVESNQQQQLLGQEEERKEGEKEHVSSRPDKISGWLIRSAESKGLDAQDEPWSQRFFRFNITTAILSEYQDVKKSTKLADYFLWKKIAWVETNLQNKLSPNYQQVFKRINGKDKSAHFRLPSVSMQPFVINLIDGDILFLWCSLNSFPRWIKAFKSVQIPHSTSSQKILIKLEEKNRLAISMFRCLLPVQSPSSLQLQSPVSACSMIDGSCLLTKKDFNCVYMEYVMRRYFTVDIDHKLLKFRKDQDSEADFYCDLRQLSWVDATLTDKFKPGYEYIFSSNCGKALKMGERLNPAKGFSNPVVLGFEDGDIQIIWLESENVQLKVARVLEFIIQSNQVTIQDLWQKYVVLKSDNLFVVCLYRTLQPRLEQDLDFNEPGVLMGFMGRAINDSANMFESQFVILDTNIGKLRFYSRPHSACLQENDVRFTKLIPLQADKTGVLLKENQTMVTWSVLQAPFAVHSGGMIFIFLAQKTDFEKWTNAFRSLEVPQNAQLDLWVEKPFISSSCMDFICQMMPKVFDRIPQELMTELSGYMCKTCQASGPLNSKIFFKRHFTLNNKAKKLFVRNNRDQRVKEEFDLGKMLAYVDTNLSTTLCKDYKKIFFPQYLDNIVLPQEFAFPFALVFIDGTMTVLWTSSQQQLNDWTRALKAIAQENTWQYPIRVRSELNFFVATLYMCLKKERPTILFDTFIVSKKEPETQGIHELKNESDAETVNGDGELAQGFTSSRGIVEGWLYKTAQQNRFFQSSMFFKRFYRLNLMMEELKIFDKPNGILKEEIFLSHLITKVDSNLNGTVSNEDLKMLGMPVAHPDLFDKPIAVFTRTDQVMLLWCRTIQDQKIWTEAFERLLLRTDQQVINNFRIVKTKKNSFIVNLYECLRKSYEVIHSPLKTNPRSPQRLLPINRQEQSIKSQSDFQNNISDNGPGSTYTQDKHDLGTVTTGIASLQKTVLAEDGTEKNVVVEVEKPQNQIQKEKFVQRLSNKVQKQQENNQEAKENYISSDLKALQIDHETQHRSLEVPTHATNAAQKIFGVEPNSSESVPNAEIAKLTAKEQFDSQYQNNYFNEGAPDMATGRKEEMHKSQIEEEVCDQEALLLSPNVRKKSVRNRRFRQIQNTDNAPIKIKNVIFDQVVEQKQLNSAQNVRQDYSADSQDYSRAYNLNQNSEDGVYGEEAAQSLKMAKLRQKPIIQRSSEKIKIRLPSRTNLASRRTKQHSSKPYAQNCQLNYGQNPTADFEEKIKGQIDQKFIEKLIRQSSQQKPTNSSVWGNIADGLREQIQLSKKNLQVSQSQQKTNMQISENSEQQTLGYPLTSLLRQNGPIKVIGKIQSPCIPSLQMPRVPSQKQIATGRSSRSSKPEKSTTEQIKKINPSKILGQGKSKTHGKAITGTDDGQLSDWDSSDDDIEREVKSNLDLGKRPSSLVNVRDRTLNLHNVYQGQVLEKSSFSFKSINPSNTNTNRNQKCQTPKKPPDCRVEDLPVNDLIDLTENKKLEMPLNDDDIFAQTYQSVWE